MILPPWLGDRDFHRIHQSNLLRKNPEHYGRFSWDVPADLPYVWHGDDPMKNEAAAALVKLRWAETTPEERRRQMRKVAAARTSEGLARAAASISPEAARARSIKAAKTRKRNAARKKK